ncbi:cation:proton antiporter [Rhodoferax saidenbachensis]|uniref:Kef-type K+ transport system membrane component KefB n=1 Tax=Rhodoferax saidenbachensis TaxID=1484693 RepID=A0ABU1ZIL3_9BURK|nr:cation:proton antiporter [Rhodoferax saidenbachensis]MDR7305208.1 Kef-type K+ transport system membrane component KefB [Rhodoferax saidenbachensis]
MQMLLGPVFSDIAWPITILIAWFAGELGHRLAKLPRISAYAIVGFVLAPAQAGLLPADPSATVLLLANIAFGLILFECGYRINLRWLRTNPWIAATSVTETALTFGAVYFLVMWFGQSQSSAVLLGSLSMATSPASILRVANEQRSSGQVTERVLHLSALNCVLAVFVYKIIVGLVVFETSGNLWDATYGSLVDLCASGILGMLAGALVPALLQFTGRTSDDSTLAFTLAIICLVALAHSLKLSPVLVALTFGLSARHRRIVLNSSQRGFGALGDLLSMLLFVYIASTVDWQQVLAGMGLGLAVMGVRQLAKIVGISLFAHVSGISWRKGLLIGVATTPISAFVILVLEQTRYLGIHLVDELAPLATMALTLEVLGPIFIRRALVWAREVPDSRGD